MNCPLCKINRKTCNFENLKSELYFSCFEWTADFFIPYNDFSIQLNSGNDNIKIFDDDFLYSEIHNMDVNRYFDFHSVNLSKMLYLKNKISQYLCDTDTPFTFKQKIALLKEHYIEVV